MSNYKSTINQPFNNIARKINFNQEDDETFNLPSTSSSLAMVTASSVSNKKSPVTTQQSPLRSPLPEQDYDYNQFDVEEDYGDITEEDKQPSPPPPVPKTKSKAKRKLRLPLQPIPIPNLLKLLLHLLKMALGKTKRLPSSFDSVNTSSVTEYYDEDDEDNDRDYGESQQDSIEDSMIDSTFNDYSQPSSNNNKTRRKIIKESPLPSPPPDNPNGLRRSKRTRIKPLAFWRNERIIYSKDLDYDDEQDTTLARDIHNIPLQLIKEVVHIPDNESVDNSGSPNTRTGAAGSTKTRLNRKRTYKQTTTTDYDYESDPEISGSEWFKEDNLLLEVNDNGESKLRKLPIIIKVGIM